MKTMAPHVRAEDVVFGSDRPSGPVPQPVRDQEAHEQRQSVARGERIRHERYADALAKYAELLGEWRAASAVTREISARMIEARQELQRLDAARISRGRAVRAFGDSELAEDRNLCDRQRQIVERLDQQYADAAARSTPIGTIVNNAHRVLIEIGLKVEAP